MNRSRYMNALANVSGDVFELSREEIESGLEASRSSPRLRMILPIHRTGEARVQRMLNFLQPGTYVQPHLHPREFASETIFVMQGRLGFVIFDDRGDFTGVHDLKPGALIDIEPGIWHGLVCLEEDTVILEIKRGPYDAETDKTFAGWAPAEGDAEAGAYLESLERIYDPA